MVAVCLFFLQLVCVPCLVTSVLYSTWFSILLLNCWYTAHVTTKIIHSYDVGRPELYPGGNCTAHVTTKIIHSYDVGRPELYPGGNCTAHVTTKIIHSYDVGGPELYPGGNCN